MVNNFHKQIHSVQYVTMQEQANGSVRTERRSSAFTPCEYDSHHGSHALGGIGVNNVEAAPTPNLDDEINHMEHSIILSGENEKPFTYIISMLAEWGTLQDTQAYIQGNIKVH
jgi:RecQ-mediated genome instability protein 1